MKKSFINVSIELIEIPVVQAASWQLVTIARLCTSGIGRLLIGHRLQLTCLKIIASATDFRKVL